MANRKTAYPTLDPYFVYVIQEADSPLIKVGVARDPVDRLRSFQTGNSRPLKITFMLQVAGREAAHRVEYATHLALGEWFVCGEWFAVEPGIAESTIRAASTPRGCNA